MTLQLPTDVFYCRDINPLSRHHFMPLQVSTGCFWCRDINPLLRQQPKSHKFHLFKPVIASRRSLVVTSIPCHDINLCRDITMLLRQHSLSLWLILSCLTCDPRRDLHQFPSIFLMSRHHNWTVQTQNCNIS